MLSQILQSTKTQNQKRKDISKYIIFPYIKNISHIIKKKILEDQNITTAQKPMQTTNQNLQNKTPKTNCSCHVSNPL